MAQWITRLTTDQKIAGSNPARIEENIFVPYFTLRSNEQYCLSQVHQDLSVRVIGLKGIANKKMCSPPGGLEPPTFRLTAERASRLRHGGSVRCGSGNIKL